MLLVRAYSYLSWALTEPEPGFRSDLCDSGIRVGDASGPFRVGNAAGEIHPLIGEGMSMALESAFLLASRLVSYGAGEIDGNPLD